MQRSQRVLLVALVGVLWAAFALRLPELGVQSLWYDETVSALLAAKPVGALLAHTARDIHPPLYYLLLHGWSGLLGHSDFALAYFSLCWGVLLVASVFTLARWLGGDKVGLLAAALVTLSPFNIWYAQEVRMYTMGATLGVWTLLALWQLLRGTRLKKRWMTLWLLSTVAALYTLYYSLFLLLWEAIFAAWWLWRTDADERRWRRWFTLGGLALLLWLPWLPTAFRQATNPPVPPWREGVGAGTVLLEGLGALALGQSMPYRAFAPLLLLLVGVILVALFVCWRQRQPRAMALLLGALLVPLAILMGSAYTPAPLYHVRYLFPFSPAFYILLAMGFTALAREAYRWARLPGSILTALILVAPLLLLSGESVQRLWHDPLYAADDLRSGVEQVEAQWRAGDLLLVNAGYTYPAFGHYFDDPIAWQGRLTEWDPSAPISDQGLTLLEGGSVDGSDSLGWGLPESDFYAMGADETLAALERIAGRGNRLWHFRLYDTVTDPDGLIRAWLDEHARLFYDQQLSGESNARVQGWYFPPPLGQAPDAPRSARFLSPDGSATWVTVHGVDLPSGPQVGGSWVDFNLWLEGSEAMDPSLHLSLGLFDTTPAERQWAVLDEQPLGPLLSLNQLPGAQRWPVRLRLPQGIPPGKYEAHLKWYRPSDGATLPPQGENLAPPDRVRVAVVEIGPTPLSNRPPDVGTPQEARFGPLKFLGHAIPPGPWEPGASIPIELVWRVIEETEGDLGLFLTSNALSEDDGGVTQAYPTDEWHAGEIVRDIHYVTVAPNAAPGEYPIYLRVSRAATVIPWTHGLFRSGEILQLGTLTVQDRPRLFERPEVATPLDVAFGDSIRLIGATLPPPDARFALGSEIPLTLNWLAEGRPPGRYKIFTHLIDEQGNLGPQRDLEPGEGRLPTNGWARGEYVTTAYTIPVPTTIPPGRYGIRVGLYDAVTGERVPPFGANTDSQNRFLLLGSVEVGP